MSKFIAEEKVYAPVEDEKPVAPAPVPAYVQPEEPAPVEEKHYIEPENNDNFVDDSWGKAKINLKPKKAQKEEKTEEPEVAAEEPAPAKKKATKKKAEVTEEAAPAKKAPAKKKAAAKVEEPVEENDEADKPKVVGKYTIEDTGYAYQFHLYANNGQLLYESREYASLNSCKGGIATFKKNVADCEYRIDVDKNGGYKYIFKLDPKGLANPMVWIFAFGQAFFSLSVAGNGSVIYGSSWDNLDFGMLYWKDGKVKYVGEDVHEIKSVTIPYPEGDETFYYANGIVSQAEIYKMSPSGNWIAGAYQEITVNTDDYSTVASSCPAFYNTETETTVVLEEYSGAKGVHVTDGGIAFIALPMAGGEVYDLNAGVAIGTVAEWVYSEYGLIIPSDIFIKSVSPDGRVVLGTGTEQPAGMKGRIYPWYIIPPAQ